MAHFDIIVAKDEDEGIGAKNAIPWNIPEDRRFFAKTTTEVAADKPNAVNAVVMGRRTWESLPDRFRPLPRRLNVVLSRDDEWRRRFRETKPFGDAAITVGMFTLALEDLIHRQRVGLIDKIFVIGGSELYHEAIRHPECRRLWVTRVDGRHGCDAFFPRIDPGEYEPTTRTGGVNCEFLCYTNKGHAL